MTTKEDVLIRIEDVHKIFGELHALNGISGEIKRGEVVVIIGPSGFLKHKEQHEIFKQTIADLQDMLVEEEGPSPAFVAKVQEKVVEWLYVHIEGFDRSVAEYKFMRENNERL